MLSGTSKTKKGIALFLAVVLIFSSIIIVNESIVSTGRAKSETNPNIDNKIVSDLSNMSGYSTEEILKLKADGMNWNEITEYLKSQGNKVNISKMKEEREKRLVEIGLGEDLIKQLYNDGFSKDEINSTKMFVERIIFGLREICGDNTKLQTNTKVIAEPNQVESLEIEIESYSKLLDKISIDEALYFIVKLKNEFGSMDKVMDEYILALQIDLDFGLYIKNKDEYIKQKAEKVLILDMQKIINTEKIETKLLQKFSNKNESYKENDRIGISAKSDKIVNNDFEQFGKDAKLPSPDIKVVRPLDPSQEIQNETQKLLNNAR